MTFLDYFKNNKLIPRDEQKEAIEKIEANWTDYKYYALALPTGVGKSHLALALSDQVSKSYLLTGTKGLQEQYENTSPKVINISGRSNYICNINSNFTVDTAPCIADNKLKGDCIKAGTCDYYRKKKEALSSSLMLTNYAYFLSASQGNSDETGFSKRDAIFMDEAHELENHLISCAELKLNPKDLYKEVGLGSEDLEWSESMSSNFDILLQLNDQMIAKILEMEKQIEEIFSDETFAQKQEAKNLTKKTQEKIAKISGKKSYLTQIVSKINLWLDTKDYADSPWVEHVDLEENVLTLSPLTAKYLFKVMLEGFADKYFFISATLPTKAVFCKELGIDPKEMLYIETDTPFKAEKSPVVILPIAKTNYKELDQNLPIIYNAIEVILEKHKDEKGIIHTSNYKIAKAILDLAKPEVKERLLGRDSFKFRLNNQELLKKHASSKDPTVLISPSMTAGIDLADELGRFQIIVKLPFLSMGDPRVKKKMELFGDWYQNQMWLQLIQSAGRSVRNENDWSTTYILDSSFDYFYSGFETKLPKWFKKRIVS